MYPALHLPEQALCGEVFFAGKEKRLPCNSIMSIRTCRLSYIFQNMILEMTVMKFN